jgi:UDP-N-acetylglucosamine acyltransferase
MLNGNPGILGGLNVVGMTRAGMDKQTLHRVRRAFKDIFEGETNVRANAAAVRENYLDCPEAMEIIDFVTAESDRAISSPFRRKG